MNDTTIQPGRRTLAGRLAAGVRGHPDWPLGAALLLLFLLLKTYGLRPAASDENIYFYLASRMAEGVLPYRDAFFAHPPVHLLPATLLCFLFGTHILLLKAIAPLCAAGSGFALWRIARKGFGRIEGLCTLTIFLFAHDLLRASSHHTGVNLGLVLLVLGLLSLTRGHDLLAGGLIAGSALTAFYLAPAGAAVALLHLARDRRRGLALIGAGLGVFLLTNLLCLMVAGGRFWEQVYAYHLMKPETDSPLWGAIKPVTFRNAALIWSPAMALAAVIAARTVGQTRGRSSEHAAAAPWPPLLGYALVIAVATGLLLASLGRLYHFYFLAAFPGLALLGGYGYGQLLRRLGQVHSRRHETDHDQRTVAALLLVLLALGSLGIRQLALSGLSWSKQRGEVHSYRWTPSPILPAIVDDALRGLFFREHRTIGSFHLGVTGYLWHESRVFQAAEPLANAVEANLPDDGTLFGDSTSTPLVALLAGRHLALDEADTNAMRFRSGVSDTRHFLDRLASAPPAGIVLRPGRGVANVSAIRGWVERNYRAAVPVNDPYQGHYFLYLPR